MASPLNFDRAVYDSTPVALAHCAWCGRGLSGEWFLANKQMICPVCAERLRDVLPAANRRALWRAIAWGAAAALGGSIGLLGVYRLLLFMHGEAGFAFAVIPVGLLIGRVMRWAARGAGGRWFQVAAALLTYGAVCIGSMEAFLPGRFSEAPLWALAFVPLVPFAAFFVGQPHLGMMMLFFAGIGMRWAWAQVPAPPIRLTGPFCRD